MTQRFVTAANPIYDTQCRATQKNPAFRFLPRKALTPQFPAFNKLPLSTYYSISPRRISFIEFLSNGLHRKASLFYLSPFLVFRPDKFTLRRLDRLEMLFNSKVSGMTAAEC
jgi:hypothetical protein